MAQTYDRATQDVGNILCMEHVNVTVPDQEIATTFYVEGLGFTRDPYMMVNTDNMWVNVGEQQFHLPTREQQVLRGHIGLVVPDLESLKQRLEGVKTKLQDTEFKCSEKKGYVSVTGPWGNKFRCYAPNAKFGGMTLGIPYVEFAVEPGTASGIAKFYKQVFNTPVKVKKDGKLEVARVCAGSTQKLVFRESKQDLPSYDGHHFAVYVANFSGPHKFLKKHGLITEESNDYQYRFEDLADPKTGKKLFKIEHEVRSLYHPMFGRERGFVNRNPVQNLQAYSRGRDAYVA
jgi:catechol-2,3-dioxygenase